MDCFRLWGIYIYIYGLDWSTESIHITIIIIVLDRSMLAVHYIMSLLRLRGMWRIAIFRRTLGGTVLHGGHIIIGCESILRSVCHHSFTLSTHMQRQIK